MIAISKVLIGLLARLCQAFAVSPDSIRQGRRGNLPPPEGGIAAF